MTNKPRQNATEEARHEYFSIIANGTKDANEPPTYFQKYNTLVHKLEAAEKRIAELENELDKIYKDQAGVDL